MFKRNTQIITVTIILFTLLAVANAGPYGGFGINGHIGDDGFHANPLVDEDAVINPIFRAWATGVFSYQPTSGIYLNPCWMDPNSALWPTMEDDLPNRAWTVSLGDLNDVEIADGCEPGQIVLSFNTIIQNVGGYDFVVFENGWEVVEHLSFAELAYVEVSSDGNNFVRFPSVSLTPGLIDTYDYFDTNNVYNLAGKHQNNHAWFTGTPFDLAELAEHPDVVSGIVDINNIGYVRIVDIPGSGDFYDEATECIDPVTGCNYNTDHPIYDPWVTWGSGGFDLEAIGVLEGQEYSADINLDGIVDIYDLLAFTSAWLSEFGDDNFKLRCDLAVPQDYIVNMLDYAEFANQWYKMEQWRNQ
ncbi:MAG: hypothetical protein K8R02_09225 [Anaerohalosphaeraceae bacterium]|nr:hypothetical protein [Anaerohalosphaeraceae bacterium]